MKKKTGKMKTNKKAAPRVQSIAALNRAMKTIGESRRDLARIQTNMDEAVSSAAAPYLRESAKITEDLFAVEAAAQRWALQNRITLLGGTSGQTRTLSQGKVSFVVGRPKVVADDAAGAISQLHGKGRAGKLALRFTTSLDKAYLGKHPELVDQIDGLEIIDGLWGVSLKPTTIA